MATISGIGFGDGATITFGGSAATSVVVEDQYTITCVTPAHAAGAVNVVVTNADATIAIITNGFTYVAPSWYELDTIPAELIQDAQSLSEDDFHDEWDDQVGFDFAAWLLAFWSSFEFSLPVDVPIHWFFYTYPPPGELWETVAEPSPLGWFQSTDSFGSAAMLIVSSVPHNPRSWAEISSFATGSAGMLGGFPGTGVNFRNHFIYASGGYTVNTDSPTLRLFDGLSDRSITGVPKTSAGVVPKAIISMILVGETIYLSTLDGGTSDTDYAGRVFSFKPLSGEMAQIGTGFSSGEVPYALCWHMNRLWCGTNQGSAVTGKIYYFRPDIDTDWTTDYTLSSSSVGGVCSLASYKGKLFVGADNTNANFAKVLVRDSLGAYTTSLTATGGTAKANNGFLHMIEFKGNLYATYWNNDTSAISKVYKFDGTSWTTQYTGSATTNRPFIGLYISNQILFVIGGGLDLTAALISSTDGTTYVDRTSGLIGTSTASPVFGEVVI